MPDKSGFPRSGGLVEPRIEVYVGTSGDPSVEIVGRLEEVVPRSVDVLSGPSDDLAGRLEDP